MIKNRFDRAVQALVTAYFDGTLAKKNCMACAVGNIVAAGYGRKVTTKMALSIHDALEEPDVFDNHLWYHVLHQTNKLGGIVHFLVKAGNQIKVTGYNGNQLLEIEKAFEDNTEIDFLYYPGLSQEEIMSDQYSGLMGVVDVLCEIEGKEAEPVKKMFDKKPVAVVE